MGQIGVVAGFAGADADGLFDGETKILPSPILSVRAAEMIACDGGIDHVVGQHDLDLHFGQEIDDIFGAAVEFGMAFLAAEALDLGDGKALDAGFLKRFLHLIELEGLDDRFDLLHGPTPPGSVRVAGQ